MRLPTRLLQRRPDAHKGDFGHVFILAGSGRFSGAGELSAEAALRAGAGLVTLGVPQSLLGAVIKIKLKEVMLFPLPETKEKTLSSGGFKKIKDFLNNIDVLIIGPGLTQNKSTQALVRKVIVKTGKPAVVDADALNALAGHLDNIKDMVFTPHPGEMARLLGVSVKKVQEKRKEFAQNFAKKHKVILVLKGHNTVVADYKGNFYLNKTGNPGMSTAGSGDVLSGIIGAFLAQGLSPFTAAKYAVYLHGLAGDLAAKEKTQLGMVASDIIDKIPEAIKKCS